MSAVRMRPSPCVTCGKRRVLNYERQCRPCGESTLAARQYAQACGSWQSVEKPPDSATGESAMSNNIKVYIATWTSAFDEVPQAPTILRTVIIATCEKQAREKFDERHSDHVGREGYSLTNIPLRSGVLDIDLSGEEYEELQRCARDGDYGHGRRG